MQTLSGRCLCAGVRFRVDAPLRHFHHCHCNTCRKAHATVYGASAVVPAGALRFDRGRDLLKAFESSPGKKRWFCAECGSHVYAAYGARPEEVILRVGLLDDTAGQRAEAHIWVSHKAPWYEIGDELPRHPGDPPEAGD
jgi:hypothetical protein